MRKATLIHLVSCLLLLTLAPCAVRAQTQRLGIPAGTYTINPKDRSIVDGYCMDARLPAPKASAAMNHLLTPEGEARVVVGKREPMSLSEAVRLGFLRVEANSIADNYTVDQLFTSAGPAGKKWRDLYSRLAPEAYGLVKDKQVTEALAYLGKNADTSRELPRLDVMLKAVAKDGDGQRVRLVNTTDEPIRVTFSKSAVFGERPATVKDVNRDLIKWYHSKEQYDRHQLTLWLENAALHAAASDWSVPRYLSSSSATPQPVVAFQRVGETSYVLLNPEFRSGQRGTLEMCVVRSGVVVERLTGDGAVARMDEASRQVVALESNADTVFVHAGLIAEGEERQLFLQVGAQSLRLNAAESRAFLSGTGELPALERLFPREGGPRNFVVYRDPLAQAAEASGQAVNTFLSGYGVRGRRLDPSLLQLALKKRFGADRNILLGSEVRLGRQNAENIPRVRNGGDVALVSDQQSFEIADFGAVANIEDAMTRARVHVVKNVSIDRVANLQAIQGSNVIVLSGHKDAEFRRYLSELARAGALKDKVVICLSCYAQGDEAFNTSLLEGVNAPRAIVFYRMRINPQAAEELFVELSKILNQPRAAGADISRLLEESARAAQNNPRNRLLHNNLDKVRRFGVIQTSRAPIVRTSDSRLPS